MINGPVKKMEFGPVLSCLQCLCSTLYLCVHQGHHLSSRLEVLKKKKTAARHWWVLPLYLCWIGFKGHQSQAIRSKWSLCNSKKKKKSFRTKPRPWVCVRACAVLLDSPISLNLIQRNRIYSPLFPNGWPCWQSLFLHGMANIPKTTTFDLKWNIRAWCPLVIAQHRMFICRLIPFQCPIFSQPERWRSPWHVESEQFSRAILQERGAGGSYQRGIKCTDPLASS